MTTDQILDTCLQITGTFEGSKPNYQALTGNGDGQGMSAGILQWCAGQGTLQKLVALAGSSMGWAKAESFFSSDIQLFSNTSTSAGVEFVKAHYLDTGHPTQLSAAAKAEWVSFLSQPETIAAERTLAETTVLSYAKSLAVKYATGYENRSRTQAFFFDLVVQQGSMGNLPIANAPDPSEAIKYAATTDAACAALWEAVAKSDPLTSLLLYYAYERAKTARSQYVWACLSRRGTIAARVGICENTHMEFANLLD